MRQVLFLLGLSGLLVGCSQPAGSGNANSASPATPATQSTNPVATQSAAANDVVATILGQPVKKSDCLSRSAGIGSPEIGIYSLVLRMLMEDFSKSQELTLSQAEIDAFSSALRAAAQRRNPDPSQPVPDPAFDEAAVQAKLQDAQSKLSAADVPLLEKLALQTQVSGLQRALELKSHLAMVAHEHLLPLRVEAALYKKYGGKVVARQISMHASGAYLKLAEEAQANGQLVFHDEALKQAFWKRLNDDLANTEVPPERVDFSLPVWMQGLAQLPPGTATTASAPTHSAGDPGMLERFAGVWHTTATSQPSQSAPDGANFTVREFTELVLKGKYLLGREISAPDGGKNLWIMTYNAQQKTYPFWIFNSTGLMGGQWSLTWDAVKNTATGRATDTPAGWTSLGTNRFPDANTNIVDFWMKDDRGQLMFQIHAEKARQSADAAAAILADWSQSEPSADRPSELRVLDEFIGTWDAATVARPAEWTPQETRMTSVVTRKWILNDRVVLDTSMHANGDESLALFGVDSQSREYRTWWFNSEGHRNSTRGTWDAATRTFSFRTEPDQGRVTRSQVRLMSPDQHEWQINVTDAAGKVYFDSTITVTRRH